jgi:hypothetical protein
MRKLLGLDPAPAAPVAPVAPVAPAPNPYAGTAPNPRTYGYSDAAHAPEEDTSEEAIRKQAFKGFQTNWDKHVDDPKDSAGWKELAMVKADYRRLMDFILDKDRVEAALVPLEDLLMLMKDRNGGALPKRALGDAIAFFEKEFGFSLRQQIPMGILPGDKFLDMVSSGMVPKDIGAGLAHGEMSHRIQWVAIMSDFKANQGAWSLTPLELLRYLNDPRFSWLQGLTMDRPGYSPTSGYRHPDNVLRFMRDDATTKARLPTLSAAITRKWEKRQRAAWENDPTPSRTGFNKALTNEYQESKAAKGWTLETGPNWALLSNPDAEDEAPLDERVQQQRAKWRS